MDAMVTGEGLPDTVDFSTIGSIDEGCARLGEFLGLGAPVSRDVFVSVVDDATYANNLYLSRVEPAFLAHVLEHPTRRWVGEPATSALPGEPGSAALVARAASALVRWTRTGFKTVDDVDYRRRLQACDGCPHHVLPPGKVVYKIAAKLTRHEAGQERICNLCGCLTASKARLEHEQCPDAHPTRPGFSRWGEPVSY